MNISALLVPETGLAVPPEGTLVGGGLPPALMKMMEGVELGLAAVNSRRAYRTALLHFMSWCGEDKQERQFTRLTVLQYKDALLCAGNLDDGGTLRSYSHATVNLRLAAVRALAQECADAGLIGQNEAAAIRRVRGTRAEGMRHGNWLSKEEVDRALLSIDRGTLRGKRDYAMMALLFTTGLRRRELVELEVSAMQARDGQWGLIGIRGKAGKVRHISLPLWVRSGVLEWLIASGVVDGPIFRSISRHQKVGKGGMSAESVKLILSQCMTLLGYDTFRPHDARRTCARLCRAGNARLEDVQELLGHSSIQTTERYLGKNEGFKRAITNLITEPLPTV